jgi:kynureninase
LPEPKKAFETLLRQGFYVDWREPDIIRAAPVALYNLPDEVEAFTAAVAQLGQDELLGDRYGYPY